MDRDAELLFMNYGFANLDSNAKKLSLKGSDEKYRYCINLYDHVVNAVSLEGRDVLEVGCGRGGGSSYIIKHCKPKSMIGIDFSKKAIDFCSMYYSTEGLCFAHGDAESLPFEENTFDVVVNIESSRAYGCIVRFLKEVYRVLRPNGYLLFADFRTKDEIYFLCEKINNSGLRLLKEEIISANVLKALDLDHERKLRLIHKKAPKLLRKSFEFFSAIKGSEIYESFRRGEYEYFNYVLQKKKN